MKKQLLHADKVREAMRSAADQIETTPDSYRFYGAEINYCGSPMCMLCWTGYFLHLDANLDSKYVAEQILGMDELGLYDRLEAIAQEIGINNLHWHNPGQCSAVFHKFAQEWQP